MGGSVRVGKVSYGWCEDWWRKLTRKTQRLLYHLKAPGEAWDHDYLGFWQMFLIFSSIAQNPRQRQEKPDISIDFDLGFCQAGAIGGQMM